MKSKCAGFTLIEIMIVVAIIGILAAVAVPAYFNHVMRNRQTLAVYELMAINAAQERYFAEKGYYAGSLGDLDHYTGAVAGVYSGEYFNYEIKDVGGGVCTIDTEDCYIVATGELDSDPNTKTIWKLEVGAITDQPTQDTTNSDESFGWSSLAAIMGN